MARLPPRLPSHELCNRGALVYSVRLLEPRCESLGGTVGFQSNQFAFIEGDQTLCLLFPCVNCWTKPPRVATALALSTSITWSRSSPSWKLLAKPNRPSSCRPAGGPQLLAGQIPVSPHAGGRRTLSRDPHGAAPRPRQQRGNLQVRHRDGLHQRHDGWLADAGWQDALQLRIQRQGHARSGGDGARQGHHGGRRNRLPGRH